MFEITKEFSFEAAHHLNGLPAGHQCGEVHGHSYRVQLVLRSDDVDEFGFVVDYGQLGDFADFLKSEFDHKDLNEIIVPGVAMTTASGKIKQPTAESLAWIFFQWSRERWPQLAEVRVSETQKSWASYRV